MLSGAEPPGHLSIGIIMKEIGTVMSQRQNFVNSTLGQANDNNNNNSVVRLVLLDFIVNDT